MSEPFEYTDRSDVVDVEEEALPVVEEPGVDVPEPALEADEGDLLEQAEPVGPEDDDYPHEGELDR